MEIKQDILKRHKVYKFDTQEMFVETITQNVKDKVGLEYYEAHREYVDHMIKLGKNYVYDIEWSFEHDESVLLKQNDEVTESDKSDEVDEPQNIKENTE